MRRSDLPSGILESLEKNHIDIELSLKILNAWNAGKYRNVRPVVVRDLPAPDGKTVIDMATFDTLTLPEETAETNLKRLLPGVEARRFGALRDGVLTLSRAGLEQVGVLLYPLLSYGVLNGGSATSYGDRKKNQALGKDLYRILDPFFRRAAELSRGRPKGITPAYGNPDGSPGYSFLELKMRNLLLEALRYRAAVKTEGLTPPPGLSPLAPMFQMTSLFTDQEVKEAFQGYRGSPLLRDLIAETGIDITKTETGIQPLVAAFTHSSEGEKKNIFSRAGGAEGAVLGLPGGHGQNFLVLREVYRKLYAQGKRFVYLGNVDNLGFTPDPVCLAILALTGKQAGFDFSFKTAVDVKGGILVVDDRGRLNCADIGPGISKEAILDAEASGKRILFNVATGLFDLSYLVEHGDEIIEELPMRWSDQDKDAGKYSQAEQVTWEIVGLLDDILIFGVEKNRRFLAAKMLLESLMTAGLGLENPAFPRELRPLAEGLHTGFVWNMKNVYGMRLEQGKWVPA